MSRVLLVCTLAVASFAFAIGDGKSHPGGRTLFVDDDGAQCETSYTTIQAAVGHASPGDRVQVCPGFYPESVTVETDGLVVSATQPAVQDGLVEPDVGAGSNCFDPVLELDPARYAIVDPVYVAGVSSPLQNAFAFKLRANGTTVRGFVVQGAWVGIDAGDAWSGHRITKNVIRSNAYFGVEFGSSGVAPSRVDHNCFRENAVRPGEVGGGLGAELDDPYGGLANRAGNYRALSRAWIDHNDTYRNNEALAILARGPYADISIDHNRQLDDRFGIAIQHSTSSAISSNVVAAAELWPVRTALVTMPIFVAAGNTHLLISSNVVQGGRTGVTFQSGGTLDRTFAPSTHVVFVDNTVTGAGRAGVGLATGINLLVPFPSVVDSLFANNTSSDNGFHGFFVRASSTRNTFHANVADGNDGNGIWVEAGALANMFEANSMHGNGTWDGLVPPPNANLTLPVVDARDDNAWGANTWLANDCDTDNQGGLICGG